jgi:hypothetical protein
MLGSLTRSRSLDIAPSRSAQCRGLLLTYIHPLRVWHNLLTAASAATQDCNAHTATCNTTLGPANCCSEDETAGWDVFQADVAKAESAANAAVPNGGDTCVALSCTLSLSETCQRVAEGIGRGSLGE